MLIVGRWSIDVYEGGHLLPWAVFVVLGTENMLVRERNRFSSMSYELSLQYLRVFTYMPIDTRLDLYYRYNGERRCVVSQSWL